MNEVLAVETSKDDYQALPFMRQHLTRQKQTRQKQGLVTSSVFRQMLLIGMFGLLVGAIAACNPTETSSVETTPAESPSENAPAAVAEAETQATQALPSPSKPSGNQLSELSEPTVEDEQCVQPQTQLDMNQCAAKAYAQADAKLNQAYQALQSQLSDSGQESLTDVELAWISFRDLECDFARAQFAGGSIAPLIYHSCMEAQTERRTAEIQTIQMPQQSFETADAQLNQTYQDLLAQLREERSRDFVTSQLAWLEYRDRNCEFEVLHGANPIEESQCLARMSTTRTAQILATLEQNSL